MRNFIVDTDTASDDAVALLLMLKAKNIEVKAVTTVGGNVPLEKGTKNALMTLEIANRTDIGVYEGASKPLMRELVTAEGVHGEDGMGDCNLIHPTTHSKNMNAIDKIIEEASKGDIELLVIGPATNIALAIAKNPEAMKKIQHIYIMGTAGYGKGNTTPVAEFNAYVDTEAYKIMLDLDVPKTIIGFDMCMNEYAFSAQEIENLGAAASPLAQFSYQCNKGSLAYFGNEFLSIPDGVAAAIAIDNSLIKESEMVYAYACTKEEACYGQVIFDNHRFEHKFKNTKQNKDNARLCTKLDAQKLKKLMISLLEE